MSQTDFFHLANAGVVRHIPPDGSVWFRILDVLATVRLRSRDTGNGYCIMEVLIPPGGEVPIHSHPHWETFWVLDGRPIFRSVENGAVCQDRTVPGSVITVASQAFHGFTQPDSEPARLICMCGAGLDRFITEAGEPWPPDQIVFPPAESSSHDRVMEIARRFGFVLY